jgi:uncharacterized protein (DUF2062 family)
MKKLFMEIMYLLVALEFILAYLYILSLFNSSYFILIRGIVWAHDYVFEPLGRGFYGLAALIVIALTLGICLYKAGGFKAVKLSKLALYVLSALTFMNIPPLMYWILYALDPNLLEHYLRQYIWISELDASIFHVYAPTYPILILATLYAWLPPVIGRAFKSCIRLNIRCYRALGKVDDHKPSDNTFIERFSLTSILLLSIILPLIPYLPSTNPDFKPVSVDIRYYSMWLDQMLTSDCWSAVEYVFYGMENGVWNGNRPLYLLLLYGLVSLGIPREVVLNFEAVFISPFFTLAVYFTAKRLSGSRLYALLASLAAVLGFNMAVGMMAGFFAAWFALIPFYICIALTPSLTGGNLKCLAIVLASSIAMLYIHPWTWSLLMAILTLQLALLTLQSFRKWDFKLDRHLLTVLLGNAIADIVKTLTYPSYGGLASSTAILGYSRAFGLEPLLDLPRNLHRLTVSYVDGLFFNPLHMALALIGILSLSKKGDSLSRLFVIWLAVVSLIFPFSSIGLQSHLLFATPFPILIAEGLWVLSRLLTSFDSKLPKLFIIFFIVSSLTYVVRALCNLI